MVNENIKEVDVSEFITENYFEYGKFINFNRVMVSLDGLKPVQRRVLLALKDIARGKLTGTVNAIGAAQVIHPFGNQSIEGVVADLARKGIINSQGDFGIKLMEPIPAAAPRYTKVGLTEKQFETYFRLLDYAPTHEGEEAVEPVFLPVPIPFALVYGTLSWGLGVICRLPAFTYESLLDAYINNDYNLLKSNYGYQIADGSQLKELWETGRGRLALSYKVSRLNHDNILVSGSGEIFTPVFGALNDLIDKGQIIINNESSTEVVLRISRIKGARSVNMDEVFDIVKKSCVNARFYEVKLVHEDKIQNLGIKDWLDITITLFKRNFDKFKQDRINAIKKDIELYSILPEIGKLVIQNKSDVEIIKTLNIKKELLEKALKKSISTLRKESFENEIERFKKKIIEIEKESSSDFIKSHKI